MKRILALLPNTARSELAYALVTVPAAHATGAHIERASQVVDLAAAPESLIQVLPTYDLVVADVSTDDPTVLYALGCAHAMSRPVALVSPVEPQQRVKATNVFAREAWTFAVPSTPEHARPRVGQLQSVFSWALNDPEAFLTSATARRSRRTVFISYAHQDVVYLNRLTTHLRPLEREGLLEVWTDTKLIPGANWRREIELALKRARIALLLLSADFMASEFIHHYELPSLLAAHPATHREPLPIPASSATRLPSVSERSTSSTFGARASRARSRPRRRGFCSRVVAVSRRGCGLTPRSSGPPPAEPLGPSRASRYIVLSRAKPLCRLRPLSSNVRRHKP